MSAVVRHAEELEQVATEVLFQAQALVPCEVHSYEYYRVNDTDAERYAYALGTNRHKKGDLLCDRQELMDAIKAKLDDAADDECPYCAHLMDQD
jgi:hypothetical protein